MSTAQVLEWDTNLVRRFYNCNGSTWLILAPDPNALLGNKTPIKIPEVIVKWLTYALVLHIVALVFAAGSAVFGLLAHIREMSMTCCSTCVSGFGAAITLIAFIFDVAFFFLTKARINKVPGGSAQIGNAIWLTLAAWILLFLAGCFYTFGRCCVSKRPRGPRDKNLDDPTMPGGYETGRAEALRLDAVKAEADRKARQKQGEIGLPAFNEYDPSKPLTSKYDEEDDPYLDQQRRHPSGYSNVQVGGGGYAPNPGYAPAAPGTSAMEAYRNTPAPPQSPPIDTGYPPQPPTHAQYPSTQYNAYDTANTQPSHTQYTSTQYAYDAANTQPSHTQYPSTQYNAYGNTQPSDTQYLSSGAYGHDQYPSTEGMHGHVAQNTSCKSSFCFLVLTRSLICCLDHTTASHYQQSSVPDPSYNPGGYTPSGDTAAYASYNHPTAGVDADNKYNPTTDFMSSAAPISVGRNDYTFSSTPPPVQPTPLLSDPSRQSPGPRGPRSPTSPVYSQQVHSDNPPGYDDGHNSSTAWPSEKH